MSKRNRRKMEAGSKAPPFTVTVEKLVAGGDGLARHGGKVVFVSGSAPGERHLVEPHEVSKDYVKARSLKLLERSPDRREPPCRFYGACGGCSLMHLAPEAQTRAKRNILTETLSRIGRIELGGEVHLHRASETGYRSRLRLQVGPGTRGSTAIGFHRRQSHRVVDVDSCLQASAPLNATYRKLRSRLAEDPKLQRSLSSIELETNEGGRFAARFLVKSNKGERPVGDEMEGLLEDVGLGGISLVVEGEPGARRFGEPVLSHEVCGHQLQQSMGSFFQANHLLLEDLVASVVPREAVGRAYDLFCGVGLFTLPLAEWAEEVVGVETSAMAVADAESNLERAGVTNVRIYREDVSSFANRTRFDRQDRIVLDPPRAGLGPGLRRALRESAIRELRYVSCNPVSLARDLGDLAEAGFGVERVDLFDFFPNTHHFETFARLVR